MGIFRKWFSGNNSYEDNVRDEVDEKEIDKNVIDYDFGIISDQDIQQLFKDDTGCIEIVFSKICQNKKETKESGYFDSLNWDEDDVIYVDFSYEITISSGQYSIQKALFSVKWRASGTWGRMAGKPLVEVDEENAVEGCIRYITPLCNYISSNYNASYFSEDSAYNIKSIFNGFLSEHNNQYSYRDFVFKERRKIIKPCDKRYFSFKYKTKEQILEDEKKKFEEEQKNLKEEENRKKVFLPPYDWITFQLIIDDKWKSYLTILNSNGISCRYPIIEKNMSSSGIARYQQAIVTDGKVKLVQLLSSLAAPETIRKELVKKDTIDNLFKCLVSTQSTEFTIYTNSAEYFSDYEKEDDKEDGTSLNRVNQIEDHSLEYYLDQLNSLIGLESVKNDVIKMTKLIEMNRARKKEGKKEVPMTMHLVFTGNPGTGKTTVARLVAGIYHQLGVIKKGQLIEVDRSKLVARYIGQTAIKTLKQINLAMGGVLFIDEAYSLYSESDEDYGREAIDTILKAMEDKRDEFIVIMAGYTAEMKKLISMNPGLESRFNKYIEFPDYKPNELKQIFIKICNDNQFSINEDVENFIEEKFRVLYEQRDENFANARTIRNIFEKAVQNHAVNWSSSNTTRDTLYIEDFIDVI